MKKIKTLKELEVFVGNLLLNAETVGEKGYFYKEFEDFFRNKVQIKYCQFFQNTYSSNPEVGKETNIKLIDDSIEISAKRESVSSERITIEESINTAYRKPNLGSISFNNIIIPKVFEDGIIFSNFRSNVYIKNLQNFIDQSIETENDITLKNVSFSDYFTLNMNHVETYIFSKKHGFRVYREGQLLKNRKSDHIRKSNYFNLEHHEYTASFFPKVADFKELLSDILKRGTIINGKEDKEIFADIIENEVIEAKWTHIFNTIDQQYNYWKKDNKISCSNIFNDDVTELSFDKFGYIIFSFVGRNIEYQCDCGEINLIKDLDYFAETFRSEKSFKRLIKTLDKNVCKSCGSSIDTSEMQLDKNRGYSKPLYAQSLYLVTYKNKPITLPVPTNTPVLGYKYETLDEKDLIMRFYSFRLNNLGLITEVSPTLVSYMKAGKSNNKFEYYCSNSRSSYPDFSSIFGSNDYSGLIIKDTPSSVSTINTEVFPLNPEENIKTFNELGFNQYNVFDLYCETNKIETLRDKFRSMVLWEGEFPVVYKTMPMLEALIKTKDYYQVGIDIINNSVSSNIIKRHLDVKETKPKNILRLSNDKLNIYNKFTKKYYLPVIDYSMIATLEELKTLDEDCDYDIFEAYHIASQNTFSEMVNAENLIPITRRSVNKIKDLNLEIKNIGNKVMRYLINTAKNEYPQGVLMLPIVADIYSDYINTLIEINNEDTIIENVLFPEHLEREHDRTSEELVSSLSKLNREKFNNVASEIKSKLDVNIEDDNYTIVIPEKSEDLILEGNTLNHCVGSYVALVANKRSTIVFVRNKDNKTDPLYTLELHNVHKRESLINRGQFYGSYNQPPKKEAQEFVDRYIKKLNSLKLKKIK